MGDDLSSKTFIGFSVIIFIRAEMNSTAAKCGSPYIMIPNFGFKSNHTT